MANNDFPRGFIPFGKILRANPYTTAEIIFAGDIVSMADTGTVAQACVSGATGAALGVAAHYAASGATVMVYDDPDQLFIAQEDADGGAMALADIGLNVNITDIAGDTTLKQSKQELDSSSKATTNTLPVRVLGLLNAPDNAIGNFARWLCQITNHQLRTTSVGI